MQFQYDVGPGSPSLSGIMTPSWVNMTYDTLSRYDTSGLESGPVRPPAPPPLAAVGPYVYDEAGLPASPGEQPRSKEVRDAISRFERELAVLWGGPTPGLAGPSTGSAYPYVYDPPGQRAHAFSHPAHLRFATAEANLQVAEELIADEPIVVEGGEEGAGQP